MNAEAQIAAAVAALRGPQPSRGHRLETGPARTGPRAPALDQARESKRFTAPLDLPHSDLRPGRPRVGIASVRRPSLEAVAALGNSPVLWGGAVLLVTAALFRAASFVGIGGPVIVHLVWPV